MLELKHLSKTYRTGDQALTDIGFTVPAGQVVGLIGPSGAGKSTLIRCINRLVEPSRGSVVLGDTELTTLRGRALRKARRRIGMIFQEYALVERLTVMENVLSGRLGYVAGWRSFLRRFNREDIALAFSLLEKVGLAEHYNKRADALSGGQRQFSDRIIGLRAGEVVFDGKPEELTDDVLTRIYGEEDWAQVRKDQTDEDNDRASPAVDLAEGV